jgi:hypothetical protein
LEHSKGCTDILDRLNSSTKQKFVSARYELYEQQTAITELQGRSGKIERKVTILTNTYKNKYKF